MRKKFLVAVVVAVGLALVALPLNSAKADPDLLSDRELGRITAGQWLIAFPVNGKNNGNDQIVGTQFNANQNVENQAVAGDNVTYSTDMTITRPQLPTVPDLGAGSGGAILGDNTDGVFDTIGLIQLSDTVQQDVKAINVVNSAESGVANAVNVWAGRLAPDLLSNSFSLAPIIFDSQVIADQLNVISQDQSRSASVGSWDHFMHNVDTFHKENDTWNDSANVKKGRTYVKVLWGLVEVDIDKGGGGAGAGDADFLVDGGQFKIDTKKVDIIWDFPKLDLHLQGAGCIAKDGASCSASRNDTHSLEDSTTISSVPTSKLVNARAEYIVGDNSSIVVVSDDRVILTDTVQKNAKAVNLVNAASSSVANGVNVAATMGLGLSMGSSFNLSQTNMIIQKH